MGGSRVRRSESAGATVQCFVRSWEYPGTSGSIARPALGVPWHNRFDRPSGVPSPVAHAESPTSGVRGPHTRTPDSFIERSESDDGRVRSGGRRSDSVRRTRPISYPSFGVGGTRPPTDLIGFRDGRATESQSASRRSRSERLPVQSRGRRSECSGMGFRSRRRRPDSGGRIYRSTGRRSE